MLKFNFAQHQKMTVELERKCREFIRTHGEVRLRQIIEVNSSYVHSMSKNCNQFIVIS